MLEKSRYKLLIVEDDPVFRELITDSLAVSGYEVRQAANGVEALPILKRLRPHILITDLRMPEMDGYELIRITRRFFPEIGVIALSGECDPLRIPGRNLVDAFFAKGAYDFAHFLRRIETLAGHYPVRPSGRVRWLSPTWLSPDPAPALWIICSKCERSFALRRWSRSARAGIHSTRCQHCGVTIRFLFEPNSLDAWDRAA